MYRCFFLIFLQFFFAGFIAAQEVIDSSNVTLIDSVHKKDSLPGIDTAKRLIIPDSAIEHPVADTVMQKKFSGDNFKNSKKGIKEKDGLFYLLTALLLLFAFLNRLFPKYFNDLYRLFFRTTLNQSQIREQLIQSPLPSLLLNVFFVITGGLYLDFIFRHYQLNFVDDFWLLFFYCCLGLTVIYLIKFSGLKTFGWLFNASEAADSYIFIVFVINKMIGIFLLPVVILLAFTGGSIYSITLTLSYCGIGAFLIYRFILTYIAVRNQISINPFHFFLYLFAFEIAPLLIIYKVLLVILTGTA